ncbi:Sodium/potassium/calcium exchanger 2 [Bienertia sinuspersici]
MEELMAELENESDEESVAEEHMPEYDIDADVLDRLSEGDEDENNTNYLDDRAIKELQIQGETKRGPTMLHKLHMRSFEIREAIIFNEFGQPIGPVTLEKDTVGGFSQFLGNIAGDYGTVLVLNITWKLVPNKDKMWEYVLKILKCRLKKKHYYRYPKNKLRWLNCPKCVPDYDFMEQENRKGNMVMRSA